MLVNPSNPNAESLTKDAQAAGSAIGRQIEILAVSTARDIDAAFPRRSEPRAIAQIFSASGTPKITNDTTVYDPTCGSGSLLLKIGDEAGHGHRHVKVTLYGQEKDNATAGLARMNMILHDYATAEIEAGQHHRQPALSRRRRAQDLRLRRRQSALQRQTLEHRPRCRARPLAALPALRHPTRQAGRLRLPPAHSPLAQEYRQRRVHKTNSSADTAARDCGVALSIALQYGADLETIRRALSPRQPRSPERCIRCRSRRHHGGRRPMSDISNNSEELEACLLAEFRYAASRNKLATAESLTLGEARSMTSEDRELIEAWHSEADRWSDPGWGDAARQYHAARGGRLLVVEIQPERLARFRQLLGDNTSLDRVWRELNERGDRPAPQATFDALLYELRTLGVAAFKNPSCRRRLADLSDLQLRELLAALIRTRARYPAITDELLIALDEIRR